LFDKRFLFFNIVVQNDNAIQQHEPEVESGRLRGARGRLRGIRRRRNAERRGGVRDEGVRPGPGHGPVELLPFGVVDGPTTAPAHVQVVSRRRRVRRRAARDHLGERAGRVLQLPPDGADQEQNTLPLPLRQPHQPEQRRQVRLVRTSATGLSQRRGTDQVNNNTRAIRDDRWSSSPIPTETNACPESKVAATKCRQMRQNPFVDLT